jgi:ArsR family transcriptional regulator
MTQVCKRRGGEDGSPAAGTLDDLLDTDLFKALGDPNRAALVAHLGASGPSTVSEAARCCPVDLSVASRHLAILREAGVVRAERKGREVHYSVPHRALANTLRSLAEALEACCAPGDDCFDPGEDAPESDETGSAPARRGDDT